MSKNKFGDCNYYINNRYPHDFVSTEGRFFAKFKMRKKKKTPYAFQPLKNVFIDFKQFFSQKDAKILLMNTN